MKQLILFIALIFSTLYLQGQESLNMIQTANWDVDTLPAHSYGTFNDIWGYADGEGNEYAIMGSAAYIHFINVSDPANPIEIAAIPGGEQTVWRDMKTFDHYAYAASDGTGEGLMIFDLSYLPDSVVKVNQTNAFFGSSHNIFIDEANGRLYAINSSMQGANFTVLDLTSNPADPSLLAAPYLDINDFHDLYVRDNIAYINHGWSNQFIIWDFNDPENPEYIASYESNGYNHSNWVSEDGNTVILAEEVPTGLPLTLLDISDKEHDNIELLSSFKFPLLAPDYEDSTPHNPYIIGDLVYTSYYEDGVLIFDISDPTNPFLAAYYDTHPQNTEYTGYAGCWGVYPFLPSGNIIASDMQNGLSILQLDYQVGTAHLPDNLTQFQVFPNPTNGLLNIRLESSKDINISLSIVSLTGQILRKERISLDGLLTKELDINHLVAGMYFVKITSGTQSTLHKIVKH